MLSREQSNQLRKMKSLYFTHCMNDGSKFYKVDDYHYLFEYKGKKRGIYVDEETMEEFNKARYGIFIATLF